MKRPKNSQKKSVIISVRQAIAIRYDLLKHDWLIVSVGIGTLILTAISIGVIWLFSGELPTHVPLLYSLPWGEERLVSSRQLYIFPISMFVIFLFNTVIGAVFHAHEPVLSRVLLLISFLTSLLGLYTLVRIIMLIT